MAGLYKNRDRATGGRSTIIKNFQSRSKILWPQNLTPRQELLASWGGMNKQTIYILSFKTNLNMDVFQIVFSGFSFIRVSAYKTPKLR